jgi:hypothetical protein
MQTIVTIKPFSARASLVAVSPAYVGPSGSRPSSAAVLSLGAGFVPRAGAELSASFEAALARGETRSEASYPFLSRSLGLSSRLPFPSGKGTSIKPGLSLGVDEKGRAFRLTSLELRGGGDGGAWSISASAGSRQAPGPGGTSYPISLGVELGPVRDGGRRIGVDLGFSVRTAVSDGSDGKGAQAFGELPRLDCRLGLSVPLPAKARLGLVLRVKEARLGIMSAGGEKPVFSLDLRYESGAIGLSTRPPPSSLDGGKAVSYP